VQSLSILRTEPQYEYILPADFPSLPLEIAEQARRIEARRGIAVMPDQEHSSVTPMATRVSPPAGDFGNHARQVEVQAGMDVQLRQ